MPYPRGTFYIPVIFGISSHFDKTLFIVALSYAQLDKEGQVVNIWRKGCASMCQKIKEIHGLQPDDILSRHLDSTASFVDMYDILSKMEIPCIGADFSGLQKKLKLSKNNSIWGMAASKDEELIIAYSKKLSWFMCNYVLAHELGHCCLHLPISAEFHVELKTGDDLYSDSSILSHRPSWIMRQRSSKEFQLKESEANRFAAQLLLPDILLSKYKSRNSLITAQDLSRDFKVPIRLAQARIDFYNEKSNGGQPI